MQALLTDHGIVVSLALATLGLIAAVFLIRWVLAADSGNARMGEIAKAVQDGAKAYLQRQFVAISLIAGVVFVGIWLLRDFTTAAGFVVVCVFATALQ